MNDPVKWMRTALTVSWLCLVGGVFGQGTQLENNYRNQFSGAGAPVGPPPPPDATPGQWQSGTAFGGWQTTLIMKPVGGSSAVAAGSPNVVRLGDGTVRPVKGAGGTLVLPSTPRDINGNLPADAVQLESSQFSRSLVLRQVTIPLGSEIARPDRQPNGDPIPIDDPNFFLPEPWNSIAGDSDPSDPRVFQGAPVSKGRFYWSPHAQQVFATEPGLVTVVWKLRTPVNPGNPGAAENFVVRSVAVSGSPAKAPRRLFWTERGFSGPVVDVPESRVGEVNVVYTDAFPREVPVGQDYQTLNDPPVDPTLALPPERRTLWYDTLDRKIHAYNLEGRVFVELLGDLREPERIFREHLGFEIVDVIKEVRPEEVRVSIGERVYPVDESELNDDEEALVPEVEAGVGIATDPYLYEHVILGGTKRTLYAVRETTPLQILDLNEDGLINELDEQQSNEVLIYWKEAGVMQLLWPKRYVGYIFKWPEDYLASPTEDDLRDFYSMYARPENGAATGDFEGTGVQLNSANNPFLQYQDDDTRQHAKLTAQGIFFTLPATGNRSLIRYTNEEDEAIWFERVYSKPNNEFDGYATALPAPIGSRIDPPDGVETTVGYIRQSQGDAFNPVAYQDPFVVGFDNAREGAIIPVNALAGNDMLEVWWYEENEAPPGSSFATIQWPSYVNRYQSRWPVTDPDDGNLYDEIVLARNDGSGELGIAASGTIYRQANPDGPGYNPNEEHALMSGGVAWALRDDLNVRTSSEPWVLVDYVAEDGRPAMVVRRVVRENATHTFNYEVPVGVILQAPMPLPVIPLPVGEDGEVRNVEVGDPTDLPLNETGGALSNANFERFTYVDRKGSTWIYRGPHADGVNVGSAEDPTKSFKMHYFYKTEAAFDFPDRSNPDPGTIVPYLRPFSNGVDASGGFEGDALSGDPQEIAFTPVWPENPAILGVAETLGLPKRGLPAVRGQTSAEILYQQSTAGTGEDYANSVRLMDPTRAKTYRLSESGLKKIPGAVVTSDYLGKTYFPGLPPHLSQRLYFDPNIGELGALVFIGQYVDAPFGEDYFLLNVMSEKDVADAKALAADADSAEKTEWEKAIDGLETTVEVFAEDEKRRGFYVPKDRYSVLANRVVPINDSDAAVDSYAISASGGGTGYVVLVTGDGEAFTPSGEPVSLHVFKVEAPLYRGELKVVASANPLDEKLTLQHTGDFAGDPSDYEFAWLTGQPVSGFPPTLYTFSALEVMPNGSGRTWAYLGQPAPGYEAARSYGFDDSGWLMPGELGANQLVINDGTGTGAVDGDGVRLLPDGVLRETLDWAGGAPIDLYVSISIEDGDGAAVFINGAEVAVWNVPGRENSVPTTPPGVIAGDTLPLVFAVAPEVLQERNVLTVDLYTAADPGAASFFDLRLDSQQETADISGWQEVTAGAKSAMGEDGKVRHTIEGASILTLTDNYFTMRYRAKVGTAAAKATGGDLENPGGWSRWLPPQLAEGWIKRVLGGINPFEQRVKDLFNNAVNTDVSLLTQAGSRWEGDIALNLANIDDFGLIEIYETVLNRGKGLSIAGAPPLNVPAANDALLLAAGYLNDLYLLLGNEAYADAANPTIAFSTDTGEFGTSAQFGELNTALFAFKGQLPTVMAEELALLRGRDDTLQPGVEVAPVYNRLVWNFTGGINSGEAVYALNYNIQDLNADGAADAADATEQFPQGHGDAYGHYLSALKVYYGLLTNENFAWTPRIEAVSVLGQPVSVDYQDERKFAAAAAALARTSSEVLDLTYRNEFDAGEGSGWSGLRDGEVNERTGVARTWGTDAWATRGGQGAYFHWMTANSVLPEEDTVNEGIAKVDRTTVPELDDLARHGESIQATLDNADAKLNPLGLAAGALSFDISPAGVDGGKTHFEQVFDRAVVALQNAEFAFENAKNSTELLRRQDVTLDERRHAILLEERAFEKALVELYGTPYTDDIGPGKTYVQGYEGPDVVHFAYVDLPDRQLDPTKVVSKELPLDPKLVVSNGLNRVVFEAATATYTMDDRGSVVKPAEWTGRRKHPGQLQTAISGVLSARSRLVIALDNYETQRNDLNSMLELYTTSLEAWTQELADRNTNRSELDSKQRVLVAAAIVKETTEVSGKTIGEIGEAIKEAFPRVLGLSNDATSAGRAAAKIAANVAKGAFAIRGVIAEGTVKGMESQIRILEADLENLVGESEWDREHAQLVHEIKLMLHQFGGLLLLIDVAVRDLDQAERDYRALVATGERLQSRREVFRKRSAAILQGYRTRDLAFRVFRDEALEQYGTLFDLASRYTYLAARAYDYETGLLDSTRRSAAAGFFESIVRSRALGLTDESGAPQFAASTTGDPGLAGVLAQLQGDWSVAKTRLGFNNPDRYRTAFSLRQEHYRIVPGEGGDGAWRDRMAAARMDDVLEDPDVRRYCLQIANDEGLPVPGLVIPFQTTIAKGRNFFGQPSAAGDHDFSPSSFATKVRAAGIGFEGYVGMDDPTSIGGAVGGAGGQAPDDPDLGFLDPDGLKATPYVYLIPVGVDSMRSPPLGDTSVVRSWSVADQAIPLPFNLGEADFAGAGGLFSDETLSEEPFLLRKHQAFRAVPAGTVYSSAPGFTNSRLIGRSVWNSQWKIVIPGETLLADPGVGLEIFMDTVRDIELFLETYSYSGN